MQLHDNYYVKIDGLDGFDGGIHSENGARDRLTIAHVDFTGFNHDHIGFNDDNLGSSRVNGYFDCDFRDSPPCSSGPASGPTNMHGTVCASTVVGDLRDGQDSSVTNEAARARCSGVSPESGIIMYDPDDSFTQATMEDMLDSAVTQGSDLALITYSNSSYSCSGTSPASQAVNSAYKNGLLSVISTGNYGHAGGCSIGSPADAASALTVGATGDNSLFTTSDWDTANLRTSTARGGHTYFLNRVRTIVDIVAPACVWFKFSSTIDSGASAYDASVYCGTSYSAPHVAGSLLNILHNLYFHDYSSLANLPGVQKALLLLMGNRAFSTGSSFLSTSYDNTWGSGKLKTRRLDSTGLDWPHEFSYGYACVPSGSTFTYDINNGSVLQNDVDRIKVVTWWYNELSGGTAPNLIDLFLQYEERPNVWRTIRSNTTRDLKQMVYASGNEIKGRKLRFRIYGNTVTGNHNDGGACPSSWARVYFAYLYEDNDRDDGAPSDFSDIDGI